ncbi:uncharacterized protein LOC141651181 [Silene latifolia]|uniref:uncharacterized protein LOC141651181 n=1 Tax=Silene latifolia TaxID=37657 RepID=UPI003D7727B2
MSSCGFWNVRGLNSINKQYEIKRFLNQNKVGLFGLVETKIKSHRWLQVQNNLCDNWSICTNSSLHSGGRIWLLWDPVLFTVNVKDMTDQVIHTEIYDKVRRKSFCFTLVYGLNKAAERESLWSCLRQYQRSILGPWMVCGDFNAMSIDERIGGAKVTRADIVPLAEVIHDCQLFDLKAIGAFFTWNNKHKTGERVYSRVDRVLVNDDWINDYPDSVANFLPEGLFDHCPCLINFESQTLQKPKPFKYYKMCALAKDFDSIVSRCWETDVQGTLMYRVVTNLKVFKGEFKKLNKEQFSDIENLTNVTETALKEFQMKLAQDPLNSELCHSERVYAAELMELRKARNMYLSQKAKMAWAARSIVRTVKCLTAEHRVRLIAPLTDAEIKEAMFDIPGNKAPGPDGYSSQFFKDTWHIVGKDVSGAIRDAFSKSKVLKQCDRKSIELMLNAFNFFSKASGLVTNKAKSNFYCNGLDVQLIKEVEAATGMKQGTLPFRYLGVNVSAKRLSVLDCHCLVERVVDRIRSMGARKLSYSGRLWIEQKADHLWVKWVHSVYIKRCDWKNYTPSIKCSWAWRKICQVKTVLHHLFYGTHRMAGGYIVQQGYLFLRPDEPEVS